MLQLTGRQQNVVIVILILIIILLSVSYYNNCQNPGIIIQGDNGKVIKREIKVHVAGAVKNPGVYIMEEGSRVEDAILKAGGPLETGNPHAVNLAKKVEDEERIFIPLKVTATSTETNRLININTATISELQQLPGIGPATAEKIVNDRETRGPFSTVEDIIRVSGIGSKTFEDIKNKITVE